MLLDINHLQRLKTMLRIFITLLIYISLSFLPTGSFPALKKCCYSEGWTEGKDQECFLINILNLEDWTYFQIQRCQLGLAHEISENGMIENTKYIFQIKTIGNQKYRY